MKKELKTVFSLVLVSAFMCGISTGCFSKNGGNSTSGKMSTVSAEKASANGKEPVVLTAFSTINTDIEALTGGDPNNTIFAKELAKRTGVTFKYILATPEDAEDKLRLLITARDIPDVFGDGGFSETYPGGASNAAEDGIIVKLNEYMDTLAPNYKKVLTSRPEYEKNLKADNGDIYGFACFRAGIESTVFFGPMIRKDILDKAGLPVPETIDEWNDALKALKDYGCKTPFAMLDWYVRYSGAFVGAFGSCAGFYLGQDGKIHFGAMEEGYKKYLQLMNTWYKNGWLDPDFPTLREFFALDAKMINGKAGACINFVSRINDYNNNGKQFDPNFNVVAAKYPVIKKGDKPLYAQADNLVLLQYFVGATGKHVEDAIRWYDYGYSEEGQLLLNFGIEGESYKMVDGKPAYTEMVTKDPNPKGWSLSQAKSMYLSISGDAPTLESLSYFQQFALSTQQQKDAVKLWSDAQYSSILPLLSFTPSERIVLGNQGNIGTYVDEMTAKFILGEEALPAWDNYVAHIRELGVDDLLNAYNNAYERYEKR